MGESLVSLKDAVGEISIDVAREDLVEMMRTLRDDFAYQQLMEIAGVDYPQREERFEIVYHLLSVTKNHRLRVRVSSDEEKPVPSVTGCGRSPAGSSAKYSTCTACCSRAIRISGGSSPITAFAATRSARISR